MPKCLRNFEFIYEGVININLMENFLRVPNFLINMMSLMAKPYTGSYSLYHFSHGPSSSSDSGMDSATRSAGTTNENLYFFSWA